MLHRFTLREKAAQLVMPRIGGEYVARGTAAHDRLRHWVEELGVGGLIITMGPPLQTAAKLNMLQSHARVPLLVAADMEHGPGQVLTGGTILPYGFENGGATRFPPLMGIGAAADERLAYDLGRVTALEARAAGVNVAFAPMVDVNNNPANPIVNTRSYGADPTAVGRLAAAHIAGLQEHGMLATAKHFPGHGDTSVDSHVELPFVDVDRARADAVELAPFRVAIEAGVTGVMAAHIAYPALTGDDTPATLSPKLIQGLLRGELGFDGLVFTDALDMGAIVRRYGAVEAALLALQAGVDVLLQMAPAAVQPVIDGVVVAVESGRIAESRLDESVERVLRAKQRLGLHDGAHVDLERIPDVIGATDHTAAAEAAAARAITVVRDRRGVLPLRAARVLSVVFTADFDPFAGRAFERALADCLEAGGSAADVVSARLDARAGDRDLAELSRLAETADAVVFAAFSRVIPGKASHALPAAVATVMARLGEAATLVVVSFGSPYLLDQLADADTFVLAWGAWEPMQTAAARAITGRAPVSGRLPIPLPPHHDAGEGVQLQPAEEAR